MKSMAGMKQEIVRVLASLLANLRGIVDELSDQNAYRRHLAAHGATDSPEEWRKFQDWRLEGKSRQGRCC